MSQAETDGAVIHQHRDAMDAYARLCCPGPEAASDLVMQALTRAGMASAYYGGRPETAWRPFLLAEVRRTAGAWAADGERSGALDPDFRLWYGELVTAFGPDDTMRRCEEASPVLQAFNALPDRARHTVWHQVVEGDPDPAGEAEAAIDGLRDSYLRRLTDRAPGPDCHHYSRMLGAVLRGTNQRTSEDLEQHLAVCPTCSAALRDLQLITGAGTDRRDALAARLLLWGHAGYLAECARFRTQPYSTALEVYDGPDEPAAAPRRRRFPVGGLAVGAVLATAAVAGVAAAIVPSLSADSGAGDAAPSGPHSSGTSAGPSASASRSSPSPTESPSTATADTAITLTGSANGRCLEMAGGTAAFGAKPVQAGCDSSTAQQWKVLDVEGDAVKLRNAASSMCLDIGGNRTEGAAISQRPCAIGEQDQMWLLKVYRHSGYVVAVCRTNPRLQLGLKSAGKDSPVVLVPATAGDTGRFALDDALK
ncbi:MAG: hypothetical protein QOF44_946 [Streptomyces sp.]|jgi:DNA-directed RNA polymerase specialized sigma24 family protein|nr:hypothetical protein [Streptomyces sp.]